jgi:putative endonuclease
VYILASKKNGTIDVGVTSDLEKRIWEHKSNVLQGFTRRYKANMVVSYEDGGDPASAIQREKQ